MIASTHPFNSEPSSTLQARFLDLVPNFQTPATIFFPGISCPDEISETITLARRHHRRARQSALSQTAIMLPERGHH